MKLSAKVRVLSIFQNSFRVLKTIKCSLFIFLNVAKESDKI